MANTVHPYKGYLNTEFRIHTSEVNPQNYSIVRLEDDSIIEEGVVNQNEYITRKMPLAGNFLVRFDNAEIPIKVEDGYKYGGNTHKESFVFDKCPWAFIVMHDRTYFHNRETQEEYVEAISPDKIEELNKDFVLMSNEKEKGVTLFSCILQRPVLFLESYIYYNDSYIVWNKYDECSRKNILTIYSLYSFEVLERIECEDFFIEEQVEKLYTYINKTLSSFNLGHEIVRSYIDIPNNNVFETFIAPHHAVFSKSDYNSSGGEVYIYDLNTSANVGSIAYNEGLYLARINNKELINVKERKDYLNNLPLIEYHELALTGNYIELDIYPTTIDVFYVQTNIKISLKQHKYKKDKNELIFSKERFFKSIETGKDEKFNDSASKLHVDYTDRYFCLYNNSESFVYNTYKYLYHRNEKIYSFNKTLYLKDNKQIRVLSRNGFWDSGLLSEGDYSLNLLNDFGVIKEKDTKICFRDSINLGKYISDNGSYLLTDNYKIYKGGTYLKRNNCPDKISAKGRYGISLINNSDNWHLKEPYLLTKNGKDWVRTKILGSLYNTSEYKNVFLSENGKQILCRTKGTAMMLNVETGEEIEFPNESYIKQTHINGIRPLFKLVETTQARLINPIEGQPIDAKMFSEYQFISPNGKCYADTELRKYVEYHNRITKEIYNFEQYNAFKKKFWHHIVFIMPNELSEKKDEIEEETDRVFSIIEKFINSHKEFLSEYIASFDSLQKPKNFLVVNNKMDINFKEYLYKQKEIYEQVGYKNIEALERVIHEFLFSFIEVKYVAIIRYTKNSEIVEKIYIEKGLQYLNYVAFSFDNRYVAIAGKPVSGGLMLLYDLKEHKTIFSEDQSSAVWFVAFGKNGHLAGYTSNPYTVILKPENDYIESSKEPIKIQDKSFLTFSPDGKYIVCSEQGYIPYRNWDGTTNFSWGHQSSSIVSIRKTENPENEIIQFNDLSDQGIEDAHKARSVASVSFSKNNDRIMMTGNNGVVIIRNLKIS